MKGEPGDRRVVRRALIAGGVVWLVIGGVLVAGVALAGGRGSDGLAAALLGLVFAILATAGWLAVSIIVDLLAGAPIGRRRVAWAAAAVIAAFVAPMLVLGAQGAR